ncbi:ISNCY family transposase [Rhizobium beringeri]
MTEAGIWVSRRERKKRVFQPRGRRDCFGELVQIDGSHHWWFENRGPKCALLVYIDDATGKLLHLRFAGSENTFDYLHATKAYLQQWGKPLAFYSDKHGVFRSTHASEKDRTSGLTQFGRALYELNIDIICANTPQAKGRVERANQTLQDRLVKEMRLRGIDTIEAANAHAPEFIADFQFAVRQATAQSEGHAPTAGRARNLDGAMCRKEVRTLSQSLTLRYDKVLFILDPTEISRPLAGKKVVVCDYPDGRLEIMHELHPALQNLRYIAVGPPGRGCREQASRRHAFHRRRAAGWAGTAAQQERPSPHRPDGSYVRYSRWQPGQWLSEAWPQAWPADGLHE